MWDFLKKLSSWLFLSGNSNYRTIEYLLRLGENFPWKLAHNSVICSNSGISENGRGDNFHLIEKMNFSSFSLNLWEKIIIFRHPTCLCLKENLKSPEIFGVKKSVFWVKIKISNFPKKMDLIIVFNDQFYKRLPSLIKI